MLKTGLYDQKITFGNYGTVPNGSGGWIPSETLTPILLTWAKVEQLKQSRGIEQVQMGLPSTYRVGVMKRSGFEPEVSMVVKWRDEEYQIVTSPVVQNTRTGQEWIFDITKPNV